jgi:hypothetical protein
MKTEFKLLVLTVIFSCLFLTTVVSANLIVKPGKQGRMVLQLFPFIPATFTRTIEIGNNYNFSLSIQLKPSENFTDIMEISEGNFTLQPNERKKVEYTVTVREPGVITGGIVVVPAIGNETLSYAYQSDLTVVAYRSPMILETYLAIILLAILFPIAFFVYKKKRSKK